MKAKFIYEAFERKDKSQAREDLLMPGRRELLDKYVIEISKKDFQEDKEYALNYYTNTTVDGNGEKWNNLDDDPPMSNEQALYYFTRTIFKSSNLEVFKYLNHPFWNILIQIDETYYKILGNDVVNKDDSIKIIINNNVKIGIILIDKETGYFNIKEENRF